MKITLMDDRILIKKDPAEKTTMSGIIIPDSAALHEQKAKATVMYAGEGHIAQETGVLIPISVKVGDRIILPSFVGIEMNIEGEDLVLIRETDIDVIIN